MLTGFVGEVLKFYEPGMMEQILAGEVNGMPLTPGISVGRCNTVCASGFYGLSVPDAAG